MKTPNSFIFLREGFKPVFFMAIISISILLFSEGILLKPLMILLFAGTLFLFRNPKRVLERFETDAIMSVCDGVVLNIEHLECSGQIKGGCVKITIINRLMDTSLLRAPFASEITLSEIQRGVQLAPHSAKATLLNEQAKIMFSQVKNKEHKMVVKHCLNRLNLPIRFYPELHDTLDMSEAYGFMLHGTVLLFLPAAARLDVKKGDELRSGETILGYFR